MKERKIKVLTAKPGLDGHDRGVEVINMALRDAGMEVIYTGNLMPQEILNAAIQEDVDVIGLSILSSSYKHLVPEFMRLMKEENIEDKLVLVGGIILEKDKPKLKELGVSEIFGPGTDVEEVVRYIREHVKRRT
jgi:methylmalonyl-CoA mutase C-terminal domain/subunit